MNYRELFQIEIDHQYFTAPTGSDLTIVPDRRTRQMFKGQHFIAKHTTNGLKMLIRTDENGLLKITPEEAMVFEIFPGSSAFESVTDASGLAEGEIWHFANAGLLEGESVLASTPTRATGSFNGFRMVAKVEIQPTLALLNSTAPVRYRVVFQSKSAKWKYYFVADHETSTLGIVDADQNLVFNPVNWEEEPQDPVAKSIQSNFPGTNLFLFESDSPIALRDAALKNLQLLRDGHLIVKHLPNPEIGEGAVKIMKIHKLISKQ